MYASVIDIRILNDFFSSSSLAKMSYVKCQNIKCQVIFGTGTVTGTDTFGGAPLFTNGFIRMLNLLWIESNVHHGSLLIDMIS